MSPAVGSALLETNCAINEVPHCEIHIVIHVVLLLLIIMVKLCVPI